MEKVIQKICKTGVPNKNKTIISDGIFAEYNEISLINKQELNKFIKDRLDFGFDSIYFRYSEVIEELSYYKEMEARRSGEHFDRKRFCDSRKMHFYDCLEQLLRAHESEDNNGINS